MIQGQIEGVVTLTGTVWVEAGATVEANLSANEIVVGGTVCGKVTAARAEFLSTGVLTGSLKSGSLSAAEGVSLRCEISVEPLARVLDKPNER